MLKRSALQHIPGRRGSISTSFYPFSNKQSLLGDGTDDFVTVSYDALFDFERTNPFSVSFWINEASLTAGFKAVIAKISTGVVGWQVIIQGSDGTEPNSYGFTLVNTNSTNDILVYSQDNSHGTGWEHVVITYDGTSDESGINFYIDGATSANQVIRNALSASIKSTEDMLFFKRNHASPLFLGANLDEISIWDKELSGGEVTSLYGGGGKILSGTESNLIALYRMESVTTANINSADGIEDSTANNLHGQGSNFPAGGVSTDVPF